MARERWVMTRDVEELLGKRGVRQLDTVETFTCALLNGGEVG